MSVLGRGVECCLCGRDRSGAFFQPGPARRFAKQAGAARSKTAARIKIAAAAKSPAGLPVGEQREKGGATFMQAPLPRNPFLRNCGRVHDPASAQASPPCNLFLRACGRGHGLASVRAPPPRNPFLRACGSVNGPASVRAPPPRPSGSGQERRGKLLTRFTSVRRRRRRAVRRRRRIGPERPKSTPGARGARRPAGRRAGPDPTCWP